jgi:hypothetical protein
MRRVTATLALALLLLGCGSTAPPDGPVQLLTGQGPEPDGCFTAVYRFTLEPDSQYGTRAGEDGVPGDHDTPVMWPKGYTGRRLSTGQVVVLDGGGNILATTGHTYTFGGGYLDYGTTRAWYACSYAREVLQ